MSSRSQTSARESNSPAGRGFFISRMGKTLSGDIGRVKESMLGSSTRGFFTRGILTQMQEQKPRNKGQQQSINKGVLRRQVILQFLKDYQANQGYPPALTEIG